MTEIQLSQTTHARWQRHGAELLSLHRPQFRVPDVHRGISLNGPLRVEILEDGIRARLLYPFRVRLHELGNRVIEAPQGFVTDFASVPRFFWRIVPPWGRYSPAAVVHDYLYATGRVSRAEADRVFLSLMEQLGVPLWKRTVMYRAVRIFGGAAWDEWRRKEKGTAR
jgi:hypothetical protein